MQSTSSYAAIKSIEDKDKRKPMNRAVSGPVQTNQSAYYKKKRSLLFPTLPRFVFPPEASAMGRSRSSSAAAAGLIGIVLVLIATIAAGETESPEYTVVHSESDFEVRLYRASAWMSAPRDEISFEKATKLGFHRLFQYIQGANLNSSRIRMTKPVLTSVVPDAGPLHSSAYFIHFYLPLKFQASPPIPLPELNLHPVKWQSHCVAVRTFSGFVRDSNVVKEAEKLAVSLSQSSWAGSVENDKYAYSIAQYNAPFRFTGRVNEVWVDVVGSQGSGCESSLIETY